MDKTNEKVVDLLGGWNESKKKGGEDGERITK